MQISEVSINGRNPAQLNAKTLMRLTPDLPIDWTQQRNLPGFHWRQVSIQPPAIQLSPEMREAFENARISRQSWPIADPKMIEQPAKQP
jgi:hypothetical protein